MLICEDGSLKILTANDSLTGLWTQPSLNPCSPFSSNKSSSKKKTSSKKGVVLYLCNGISLSFRLTNVGAIYFWLPHCEYWDKNHNFYWVLMSIKPNQIMGLEKCMLQILTFSLSIWFYGVGSTLISTHSALYCRHSSYSADACRLLWELYIDQWDRIWR